MEDEEPRIARRKPIHKKERGEWSIGYNNKDGLTLQVSPEAVADIVNDTMETVDNMVSKATGGGGMMDMLFGTTRRQPQGDPFAGSDHMELSFDELVREFQGAGEPQRPPSPADYEAARERGEEPMGRVSAEDAPRRKDYEVRDGMAETAEREFGRRPEPPEPSMPPGKPIPKDKCKHPTAVRVNSSEHFMGLLHQWGYKGVKVDFSKGPGFYCPYCLSKVM